LSLTNPYITALTDYIDGTKNSPNDVVLIRTRMCSIGWCYFRLLWV